MGEQSLTMEQLLELRPYFDLGHQGDVDFTQIASSLRMTPTERLRRHEGWRLFVKEALANAALRQRNRRSTGPGSS
jgi:hypothetical protein